MAITSGSAAPLKARRAKITGEKHIYENRLEQLSREKQELVMKADAAGQSGSPPDAFKQKERAIDQEIERIQHGLSMLETQEQSIEKKLTKNIQSSFKVFG